MDNNLIFPPLDKNNLMVAVLSPVLNQWVADTVAFHQLRLKLAGVVESGRPVLTLEGCRAQAEEFRDLVLRQAQAGLFNVNVPFGAKGLAPTGALSSFPFESLQRLSELQSLGLLPGIRLVWPPELAHLDKWGVSALPMPLSDQQDDWSTASDGDESSDGEPLSMPKGTGRRRGPGDKCAIS